MSLAYDACLETTTVTGTGNATLLGAVDGFRTLASAVPLDTWAGYRIQLVDANGIPQTEWESGLGYLSGATTFVRADVRTSSNAGAAVNFSAGTKQIFLVSIAAEILHKNLAIAIAMNLTRN